MDISWIVLAILIALAVYAITIYNKLVKGRQMADEGWSGIDVQLKRRSNLIPNLVETVKGYTSHEQDVLHKVTEMRARAAGASNGGTAERAQAESDLSKALVSLMAVAENYPDLKASDTFATLQKELSSVEDEIQMARRYYNGTVRDQNILVESFPSNIVANSFQFVKRSYFELENEAERQVPKIDF
ncbi:MAG: LemA family protein [Cohaesibacter sp.]|nr:LemA family protein [Cohaesibacter sp.]